MFGYVRPSVRDLPEEELDRFRAMYCGLCHTLSRRYGQAARFILNYDFTYLAILLSDGTAGAQGAGRCYTSPIKKRPFLEPTAAMELAADESVILAWWQLRDAAEDKDKLGGLPARALGLLLTPAYRKAARLRPEFDRTVKGCLEELAALERENCPSMDRAADTFARLLQSAAPVDDPRHRVLEQLLYHLGRWIYLIDARDDLAEDLADGRYNPVAARFGPEGDDGLLKQTLDASLDRMGAAFQLGEFGCRTALLENLIYLGLPLVQRAVFDGSWAEIKKQKIWSRGQ